MATQEDRLGLRSASERLQDSHSQTNRDAAGRSRRAEPGTQTSRDKATITPLKSFLKRLGSRVTERD